MEKEVKGAEVEKRTRAEEFISKIKSKGYITDDDVKEEIKQGFADPVDKSFFLEGFEEQDLSRIDMSQLSPENFARLTYDSETKFSEEQCEKFEIKTIMEKGKSLNVPKKFHEKGINGEGTCIVIIDSCFNSEIEEFKDGDNSRVIDYRLFKKENTGISNEKYNYRDEDVDEHHGKTTASLAVGNACGVAPKAKMYLLGRKGNFNSEQDKEELLEAMLEYVKKQEKVPDIISMSAISYKSYKSKEILDELQKKGCILLDSDKFWEYFSLGKVNENGEFVLNEYMEEILNMEYDKDSPIGKRISNVKNNVPNSILIPSDGRTSVQTNKKGYKYIGSFCGASFAIAQIAGLFLDARQINKSISFDDENDLNSFIAIAKETSKTNSEGMKYLDAEALLTEIEKRKKLLVSENDVRKMARDPDVAMQKQNAKADVGTLENEQKLDKDNVQSLSEG